MGRKKKKEHISEQDFQEGLEKVKARGPVIRGGRDEQVLPDRKKEESRKSCRKKVNQEEER